VDLSVFVVNQREDRFQSTKALFNRLGHTHVHRVVSPAWDSERVKERYESESQDWSSYAVSTRTKYELVSSRIGFETAWIEAAALSNWSLIVEDDVTTRLSAAEFGRAVTQSIARSESSGLGVASLGMCGPTCGPVEDDFAKCYGSCTHAVLVRGAVASELHRRIFDTFRRSDVFRDSKQPPISDIILRLYEQSIGGVWLAGVSLVGQLGDHFGVLYQDRNRFATTFVI
jgi:hypothetical protein